MTLHWDTIKSESNPQGQTLLGDVWNDLQAETKPVRGFSNQTAAITQEIQRRLPLEQNYSDSLVCDALIRFASLDAMKVPGAEFRDTMTVLSDQLRGLTPKRMRDCLPRTAAGFSHAIRRSEIFLLGTLTFKWTRSNGRSLIILRRVEP
jgi:hypothetical protein